MNLSELVKQAHETAVEKGWYDEHKPFDDLIALCHSELSEALEEYRKNVPGGKLNRDPMSIYYSGDGYVSSDKTLRCLKPEGIPIELADVVIRIADMLGYYKVDVITLETKDRTSPTFGEFISSMHYVLSQAYHYGTSGDDINRNICLIAAINFIQSYAKINGIDLDEAIRIKMEYNKTRPYKHGNKVI